MRLRFKENNLWNSASSGGTGKQTVFSILFRSVLKVAGLLETRACQVGLKKKKNPFTGKRANRRREEKPGKGNSIHWHACPFLSHWVSLAPALYSQGAPSSPQDRLTGYRTARGAGVCLGTLGWGEFYLSQLQDPSSLLT